MCWYCWQVSLAPMTCPLTNHVITVTNYHRFDLRLWAPKRPNYLKFGTMRRLLFLRYPDRFGWKINVLVELSWPVKFHDKGFLVLCSLMGCWLNFISMAFCCYTTWIKMSKVPTSYVLLSCKENSIFWCNSRLNFRTSPVYLHFF